MVMTNMRANPYARAQTGIWRSEDGGVSWSRAHALGNCGEPRTIQNTLAWAPSSVGQTEADALVCRQPGHGGALGVHGSGRPTTSSCAPTTAGGAGAG